MAEINQESAMNTETKEDATVPLLTAAREIHAPQINSEAAFNASPFRDEGFALRFNETFKITLLILGNRT